MKILLSFRNYKLIKEGNNGIQKLSGFMIIVEDKVLLVKPRKYKGMKQSWSIPKGKLEGKKFTNALRELEEETEIILNKNIKGRTKKVDVFYRRSSKIKKLTAYVLELGKDDLNVDVDNKWEIQRNKFDRKEIYKAKFFTKEEALRKIEMGQKPLLKMMLR